MLGIRKTIKCAVGWLQPLENQRYQMVLPPVGTTLLMMANMRAPCSKRHKYPLRAYPSLHNKFKQSVFFKLQSQVTVDKKPKRCLLQTLLVKSYVAKVHNTIQYHSTLLIFLLTFFVMASGF